MDEHNRPEHDGRAAEHKKGNGAERIEEPSLAGQKSAVGQKEVDMKRRA
ncbi:MAG: hypothetical protein J1E07_06595 [Treponema sp.]|nr:hypothetical protein [Treponema sp.]